MYDDDQTNYWATAAIWLVGITAGVFICWGLFLGIRALVRHSEQHSVFLAQHCKLIATSDGSYSYGYGMTTSGKYGYGNIWTDGSKTYKCDDGVTRTEAD